jgi:hypothetical protein
VRVPMSLSSLSVNKRLLVIFGSPSPGILRYPATFAKWGE